MEEKVKELYDDIAESLLEVASQNVMLSEHKYLISLCIRTKADKNVLRQAVSMMRSAHVQSNIETHLYNVYQKLVDLTELLNDGCG